MKRFSVLIAMFIAVFVATTGIAQAKCSNKSADPRTSIVEVIVDVNQMQAVVVLRVNDGHGNPVCNANISVETSRNLYAPSNGWPENVDKVIAASNQLHTDQNGVAFILIVTDHPAGTTLYVYVDKVQIGPAGGVPFSYSFEDPLPSPGDLNKGHVFNDELPSPGDLSPKN